MNGIFDSVEIKMLEELSKKGAVVGKKYSDKKKYLKELVRRLYLNLWGRRTMTRTPTTKWLKETSNLSSSLPTRQRNWLRTMPWSRPKTYGMRTTTRWCVPCSLRKEPVNTSPPSPQTGWFGNPTSSIHHNSEPNPTTWLWVYMWVDVPLKYLKCIMSRGF